MVKHPTLSFGVIVLTALVLVPAGAHLAELPHKLNLDRAEYQTVQQIYRGWSLFGVAIFAALAATALLAFRVQRPSTAFTAAVVALLCLIAAQIVFWSVTFPVNQATDNWTVLPGDWSALRVRWEYSHAASACLTMVALCANVIAALQR